MAFAKFEKEDSGAPPQRTLFSPSDVVEVYNEMFSLLEEYAPSWYTEELHDRAVAGLHAIKAFAKMPATSGQPSRR
jgi:hypothetical protein